MRSARTARPVTRRSAGRRRWAGWPSSPASGPGIWHHLVGLAFDGEGPSASGLLVLGLATALGVVGFVDDMIKIRRSRNLGLNKTAKTVGQLGAAILFGALVLQFRNGDGLTPGSAGLSYVREIATVTLAPLVFVVFVVVVVSAWSNAVNFTDGLDGWRPVPWRWSVRRTC